jgi:hypothetical protein
MTESKRGRPALPDEQKRQQIGVRTSPTLKAALEQAAAHNGRSVAQEAEWRLQRTFEEDERAGGEHTARLLRIVGAEIEKIESITGKRWSTNLKTWAAVARMFATGPIREARPDKTSDDEFVMGAWNRLYAAQQERKGLIDEMAAAGIPIHPDLPEKARFSRNPGLFGSGGAARGLLSQYVGRETRTDMKRESVRKYIQDVADAESVDQLLAMLDRIVELDDIERTAKKDWDEARKPYNDAEDEGVKLFQEMMQRRAQERFAVGDYSLMGEAF